MLLRIEVTQADIDEGERGDCFLCPIARACERALDEQDIDDVIQVGCKSLAFLKTQYHMTLPVDAIRFIVAFDSGRHAEPFAFDIEYPHSRQE